MANEYSINAYQSPWIYALTSSIIVFVMSMLVGNLGKACDVEFLNNKYINKIFMVIAIFAAHYIINVFINTDNEVKKCEAINSGVYISWVVLGTFIYFGIKKYLGDKTSSTSSSTHFTQYRQYAPYQTQTGGGQFKDSLMYAAIVGILTFFLSLANRPIMRTVSNCKTSAAYNYQEPQS